MSQPRLAGLRVVILAGNDAQAAWQLFLRSHGAWVRARGIESVETYYSRRQALQHPDPVERTGRKTTSAQGLRGTEVAAQGQLLTEQGLRHFPGLSSGAVRWVPLDLAPRVLQGSSHCDPFAVVARWTGT